MQTNTRDNDAAKALEDAAIWRLALILKGMACGVIALGLLWVAAT